MDVPVKRDSRDIDLGPMRLTATGVEFLAAPTLEQWRAAMQWTKRCEGAVAWWLGDLVVNGENMFGEDASCEYERETIRKFTWVAEKVQPSVRRKALSFTHHEKVAKLPHREQQKWLLAAEQHGWSAKELAKQIKGEEPEEDEDAELCPVCGKKWNGIHAT